MAERTSRILVIDDQAPTRYIFRRILSRAGYKVEEASTGSDGLKLAQSLPDLIIVDVNLPDMLGYEVCRRLRSNPLTASIPVLQISASFISDESKVQALQVGADSYLTQPLEPAVLLAQVNALLRLKRAEALSTLSARQWQTTFDALSDGLALIDSEDRITRVNRTFLDLLGFVTSEVEGVPISDVFESRFTMRFQELVKQSASGQPVELDAETRWFRVHFDRIDSEPFGESGSILLITDITDHRKLQETLRLSERLAATGRLAHIIAHEINNPLEAMSNLLFLCAQSSTSAEDIQTYVNQASNELARISQITKQVLAYHRASTTPVTIKANELLEGVLAMFRAQILLNKVELIVGKSYSGLLRAHPGEIRQVFSNLVANALDAIGADGGRLYVRSFLSFEPRTGARGIRFIFSDTGAGIPAEVCPRIFEAFYSTKEQKGSGIGLWLSAEVIGKHNGSIRLRTRTQGPYRGTLFSVFLPTPS